MMTIVWTIIIGFLVGLVARALMPGRDALGILMTTLLGIGGAFIGQFLGSTFGLYPPGHAAGFIMSVIGALLLLFIYNRAVRTA